MDTTLIESFGFDFKDDNEIANKKVCGGRYTFKDFVEKFSIKVVDNPSPSPHDLVKANKKLSDLYTELCKEKAIAQFAGRKSEVTFMNTLLESLDYARKAVHMMVWSRGIESKVGEV